MKTEGMGAVPSTSVSGPEYHIKYLCREPLGTPLIGTGFFLAASSHIALSCSCFDPWMQT
jgi:hypothetical protein